MPRQSVVSMRMFSLSPSQLVREQGEHAQVGGVGKA